MRLHSRLFVAESATIQLPRFACLSEFLRIPRPIPRPQTLRGVGGTLLLWTTAAVAVVLPANALFAQDRNDNGREPAAFAMAAALEKTFVKVIERAERSVVSIARIKRNRAARPQPKFIERNEPNRDDPTSPDFIPNDFGSGVIIAPPNKAQGRVVLTNYHVVKGGPVVDQPDAKADSDLYVRLWNRRGYYAKIIAADPRADLAVLHIDYETLQMKPENVFPLPIPERKTFRKGQLVLALGNPYAQARDGSASASWGMISNISRRPKPVDEAGNFESRRKETLHHLGTLLQVDTRLSIGTSGGALLNLKGELIGLTTSLAALEGYETSVGYAIPMNAAMRRIVTTLTKGYEAEYGYLGVTPQDISPDRFRALPTRLKRQHATIVVEAHTNSPAQRGGVRAGDIILEVDGDAIHDRYDLMRCVGRRAPNSRIRMRIWRGAAGRELTMFVTLGKWPVINEDDIIATAKRYPPWRGVTVDYPTARHKYLQRPYRYRRAVVVLDVTNPALEKSDALRPGDFITHVNGRSVQTPKEFHAAVQKVNGAATLRLSNGSTLRVAP